MREIGKELSEKSKGLFSPEDWVCKSCGNINWARRNTCNVCNTSRVNTLGQRTGYGGGFMERDEVVEYKRRGDSDDEFDEFGRKKKRFRKTDDRGKNPSVPNISTNAQPSSSSSIKRTDLAMVTQTNTATEEEQQEQNDDEEEEESGDDADLSKYDIWGDSENEKDTEVEKDENNKNNKQVTSKNVKRRPSPTTSSRSGGSGSDSDDDESDSSSSSSSSSSSGSSGSRSGSSGHSSRSSSASKSRSRSPKRAARSNSNKDSGNRDARARTSGRRTSSHGDKGHERSRSPMVARS